MLPLILPAGLPPDEEPLPPLALSGVGRGGGVGRARGGGVGWARSGSVGRCGGVGLAWGGVLVRVVVVVGVEELESQAESSFLPIKEL